MMTERNPEISGVLTTEVINNVAHFLKRERNKIPTINLDSYTL